MPSSRLFNVEASSPVHAMRGMPALAAAVDMVDDRSDYPDPSGQVELNSLREAHSRQSQNLAPSGAGIREDEIDTSPHDLGSVPADPTEDEGIGTLVMFSSGRAKFLGRTAGSEWLKNVSSPLRWR